MQSNPISSPDYSKLNAAIFLVIPSLEIGGAEKVMVTIGKSLKKKGYSVELWPLLPSGPLAGETGELKTKRFRSEPERKKFLVILCTFLRLIFQLTKSERPVVLLSSVAGTNILCCLLKLFFSKKITLLIREADTISNYKHKLKKWLAQTTYQYADKIIAVSAEIKDDLVHELFLNADRVAIINNPVDFSNIVSLSQLNPPTPLLTHKKNVVCVGRLAHKKGIDTLIKAFAKAEFQNATQLVIVGSGPARNELEALTRSLDVYDRVIFCGEQINPYPYFRIADVFVLSSRWEGFVNVLLEAMAIGVPAIISTRCRGGPADILQEGKFGTLVAVDDVNAMSTALIDAIDHKKTAPPYDLQAYTLENIVSQYEATIIAARTQSE